MLKIKVLSRKSNFPRKLHYESYNFYRKHFLPVKFCVESVLFMVTMSAYRALAYPAISLYWSVTATMYAPCNSVLVLEVAFMLFACLRWFSSGCSVFPNVHTWIILAPLLCLADTHFRRSSIWAQSAAVAHARGTTHITLWDGPQCSSALLNSVLLT
jgi:hypothetical protein